MNACNSLPRKKNLSTKKPAVLVVSTALVFGFNFYIVWKTRRYSRNCKCRQMIVCQMEFPRQSRRDASPLLSPLPLDREPHRRFSVEIVQFLRESLQDLTRRCGTFRFFIHERETSILFHSLLVSEVLRHSLIFLTLLSVNVRSVAFFGYRTTVIKVERD